LDKIRAIHITIMLSVMAHGALLFELGGLSSAGKRPVAQPSRMIYVQAHLNQPVNPPQPETEQQPESTVEPEPPVQPQTTQKHNTSHHVARERIAEPTQQVETTSAVTQPAAPLQHSNMASVIEEQQSYILRVLEKIEEQKSYPLQARRRHTSGSVTLSIRVSSAGVIEKLECLRGPASLCRAAVNSADKAQPFPALPEGTNHLAFEYQMLYKLH